MPYSTGFTAADAYIARLPAPTDYGAIDYSPNAEAAEVDEERSIAIDGSKAADCFTPYDAIFVFAGPYTYGSMGDTARFDAEYDGNWAIGLGYQHFGIDHCDWQLGWEIGGAARFGDSLTGELWAGPAVRYDGLVIADYLKITPSITGGLSAVSDTMGGELRRETGRGGNATLLLYCGPEFAFSTAAHPNVELIYRLHHRSGSGGLFGEMRDAYNVNVLGLRFRY
jgi:hypothetical protein